MGVADLEAAERSGETSILEMMKLKMEGDLFKNQSQSGSQQESEKIGLDHGPGPSCCRNGSCSEDIHDRGAKLRQLRGHEVLPTARGGSLRSC